jgi:PhnB protein
LHINHPEVSMPMTPHIQLAFDGQCEAAFGFYEQCLNGAVTFKLTWGKSPMAAEVPAEWQGKICHATLRIGDTSIMGCDVPPGTYEPPRGFEIDLPLRDPGAAQRLFEALATGGRISKPLQETFWAHRYGVLVDRFGVPWSINCEKDFGPPS